MFLLVLPFGSDEQETCNNLRPLFPLVRFAHLNWTTELSGAANDANYALNQASLHPTGLIPNASINVEGAWDRTVGRSTIKVGVADSGILASHADFQFNGSSVVVAGYDAIAQTSPGNSFIDPPTPDLPNGHGTLVAGIIGAVRNNGIGVAGIAGGDASTATPGVSLYSLRCSGVRGDVASLTSAIIQGITPTGTGSGSGYGVQAINISLNQPIAPEKRVWIDNTAAMMALRQAHRNKVTIVASAGNNDLLTSGTGGSDTTFPAHARDAWTLTVGGSDENGNRYEEISRLGGAVSAAHPFVDVVAPANKAKTLNATYNTVYSLGSVSQTTYAAFSRTSAAAAHATGVAALMMSYYNNPGFPAENLQPEDVENLLKLHAKDITTFPATTGEDDYTGAGLIDATSVITGLRTNRLIHSAAATADPSAPGFEMTAVPGGPQNYYMEGGSRIQPGVYNAQAYRVRIYANGDWSKNSAVIKRWGLNASSSFFGPPEPFTGAQFGGGSAGIATPSQMVLLEPAVSVVGPIGKTIVVLEGYVYQLNTYRSLLPGAPNQPYVLSPNVQPVAVSAQWMPFNPSTNPSGDVRTMRYASYSVYFGPISQRAAGNNPEEPSIAARAVAYPNPATDRVTLAFDAATDDDAAVQLTTLAGQVVRSEKHPISRHADIGTVEISLAGLPTGTYLYRIATAATVRQGRLTKSE